jgi:hypothetical protein
VGEIIKKAFKSQYKIHQFNPSFSGNFFEIDEISLLASISITS